MTEVVVEVLAEVGSIVVVGALTCYTLLYSVSDLKAAQMNVQHSLIHELLLYEFEQGYNTVEATEEICYEVELTKEK